jgi:hypothetical protein
MDQIDKDNIQKAIDDNAKYIYSSSIDTEKAPNEIDIQIDFNSDLHSDYGLTELGIQIDELEDGRFRVEFDTFGSPGEDANEEYYMPTIDIIFRMKKGEEHKIKKIMETANKFLGLNLKRLQGWHIPISGETIAEIITKVIKNSDYGWDEFEDIVIELKTDPNVDLLLGGSYD